MSLAYKVDELLALRDSVSESAVSIEKFPDEDVIREHVLRPSASAAANLNSRLSNRSLQVPPTTTTPAPLGSQKRPSPTPSLKRGKAEKLLKEHGSPPGLRVTAGGRIVPSDLPPLGTARYGDTAYRPQQPLRVAPGNVMPMQAPSNGTKTARIEVIGGQPVIFVGDRMFALPAVSTTSSTLPPSGSAAMDPAIKRGPDPSTSAVHGTMPGASFEPPRSSTQTPFASMDLATLKAQQTLKKQELRTVEQTEVLQSSHQSNAWRAGMIEKKRCLIVELDALRKQISALESGAVTAQPVSFSNAVGTSTAPVPSFGVQNQQPFAPAMYPFATGNQYAPMTMYQPQSQPQPYGGFPGFPTVEPAAFVTNTANPHAPHSPPGSANRRSCAIEIKPPPPEEGKKPSALNPKSPTYEPAAKSGGMQGTVPPTPSPEKSSPWHVQEASEPSKHDGRAPTRKHSVSSVDTMDFFPINTHEHSSTRVAPPSKDTNQSTEIHTAPLTPEEHWPASPWNEGHSGRTGKHEPAPKLTSWPEAFGKQPSLPSLRQSTANQSLSAPIERIQGMDANIVRTARSSNAVSRMNSAQNSSTGQSWKLSDRPVMHVLSTYQEGYQAGYDHFGIPDSPDVLQGYIQGLLHFLTDETKKRQAEYQRSANSSTPSLRGLVAGSLPHDSPRGIDSFGGSQENIRLSKPGLIDGARRDFRPGSQGDVQEGLAPYNMGNEVMKASQQRIVSGARYLEPPSLFPLKMASGHVQAMTPNTQNDANKEIRDKGIAQSNGEMPQQFLGIQVQNRNLDTPLTMQRYHSTAKEQGSQELGRYGAPSGKAFTDVGLTGLDGAMDELAEMINDTQIDDCGTSRAGEKRPGETANTTEYEESDASCFKSSSGKGKQKAASSPTKTTDTERETVTWSRTNTPRSPKKAGEHSPAKAKLEQVTNKFRRGKKDDVRTMSPEERTKRAEKWRQRFQQLKRTEMEEIEAYRRESRT
ncbi:hypothetical protein COCC4DRAFT_188186 [Bipolaris maydis ATCC 48331]|uniref:Uncharacterized protein n=2 Tax=Cochliobolus heterostrophus TaxID=5016 RepID=N4XQQ1_COCH4|nr:uncharacterized protein COCC4DRAFT_188186 [Bipolaris maydis ATCC 48331]ENI08631.1 hypothetical protein COCC4DRAFT_188186 [Bipolaris maydis ATCC 48331]